jgi:mono/diheme cytochrome c family protein
MQSEPPQSCARRRVTPVTIIAAGALIAAGCGSVGYLDAGNKTNGKKLFVERCGSCHILADAGTKGEIGPNLDFGFFAYRQDAAGTNPSGDDLAGVESTVRQVVRGQIAYPVVNPASGAPGMPANIVTGQDADDVAAYVASVAGTGAAPSPPPPPPPPPSPQPPPPPPPPSDGEGDAEAGKQVFAEAGCESCHTLADAGATGSVGPNLDDSQPSAELVVTRVTNGQGAMPSFKDQLSEQQIKDVSAYVSSAAGK